MKTTKLAQDSLLPEQLVPGRAIPQDFLGMLLDKLSGENKAFFVNRGDPEGKRQGPEAKQNDEPSGGMDEKKELLSLLQAWFLRDQSNTGQPPVRDDVDEKGGDAGVHPVAGGPSEIVERGAGMPMAPFLDRPDDIVITEDRMTVDDDSAAKDDLPDSLPDMIDGYVQMLQAAQAGKDRFLPVQDNVIANKKEDTADPGDIPIKPVFYKQKEDRPLRAFMPAEAFAPAAAAEDKLLQTAEDGRETEIKVDYRVLFQKRDVEASNQKAQPVKAPVLDETFSTTRNAGDDGKTAPTTIKRPTATVARDSMPEKVEAIPGDDRESAMLRDDSGLFQRGDHLKTEALHGKDGVKAYDKTAFGSVIADRVEQVVEQYANKNSSSDMVVRLKIDGKETILVGLKDEGQKVSVQIKTGSEGVMNFIQSQKDAITRSLESKNIYATIMVDINDQRGFERNNRDGRKEEDARDGEQEEFNAYLNAMA